MGQEGRLVTNVCTLVKRFVRFVRFVRFAESRQSPCVAYLIKGIVKMCGFKNPGLEFAILAKLP